MSRPLYETEQDRENERRLAEMIGAKYNYKFVKMPIKLSLDYMLIGLDGMARAFMEMRQRKTPMHKYPTYMISLYKVMMASQLTQTTGLPCYLAVQWSDKAGICKLPPHTAPLRIAKGGSMQRGDPQDIEPVVYFDMSCFKELASE
jgi:hypothetical protein